MIPTAKHWLVGLAVFGTFVGLVLLASLPTGEDEAAGVVPDGSRLVDQQAVDDVEVLLLSEAGHLRVQVAYRGPKGWLDVVLDRQDDDVLAARAATDGSGPIPALTVVYGRAPGDAVDVRWSDGTSTSAVPASDGAYLVARPGTATASSVVVRSGGSVVATMEGP